MLVELQVTAAFPGNIKMRGGICDAILTLFNLIPQEQVVDVSDPRPFPFPLPIKKEGKGSGPPD